MLKLNIGFAMLQTKACFADSAKLMLNLHNGKPLDTDEASEGAMASQ